MEEICSAIILCASKRARPARPPLRWEGVCLSILFICLRRRWVCVVVVSKITKRVFVRGQTKNFLTPSRGFCVVCESLYRKLHLFRASASLSVQLSEKRRPDVRFSLFFFHVTVPRGWLCGATRATAINTTSDQNIPPPPLPLSITFHFHTLPNTHKLWTVAPTLVPKR